LRILGRQIDNFLFAFIVILLLVKNKGLFPLRVVFTFSWLANIELGLLAFTPQSSPLI
jgi:hypothetical protein